MNGHTGHSIDLDDRLGKRTEDFEEGEDSPHSVTAPNGDPRAEHEQKKLEEGGGSTVNGENEKHLGSGRGHHEYLPFFSPALAVQRKEYFTILARVLVLTIVLMWGFLPLFWGSLATSNHRTSNLVAWVIDRDGSIIGQGISKAVTQSLGQNPHLGWTMVDASDERVRDDASVMNSVVDERTWVALVINQNATSTLLSALQSPSSSNPYNPTNAMSIYYAQARNEQASGSYIVPIITQLLQISTPQVSASIVGTYLDGIKANQTALGNLGSVSNVLVSPVGWKFVNLRPYSAPVAAALTLVGQIYLCIFAFIMTMAHFGARALIAPHLKLSSLIRLRLIAPMILYIPLSMSFAMVSLPFKAPFGTMFSYAGGFFLYFAISYLTMAALGLATEAMITLLGTKFIAFFLLALIISNVSVATLPSDLQPGIFKYGRGWPVFNTAQSIRTILFGTKSHLGANIGVLVAWVLLSLGTTALFTMLVARRERRKRFGGAEGGVS